MKSDEMMREFAQQHEISGSVVIRPNTSRFFPEKFGNRRVDLILSSGETKMTGCVTCYAGESFAAYVWNGEDSFLDLLRFAMDVALQYAGLPFNVWNTVNRITDAFGPELAQELYSYEETTDRELLRVIGEPAYMELLMLVAGFTEKDDEEDPDNAH